MHEIGCMCETCKLDPINTCNCEFAAKMRGEVRAELDTHDVSTETGRHVASDSVRASLVAKYGPKVLRHPPNLDAPAAIAAVVIVLVIVLLIGVRTIRGRRRQGGERERDDLDG
jgi:cytochrome c-type biogenesis protein CcmH/NrfF